MPHEFLKFIQFGKVEESDDGGVVVWGVATHQEPDADREICDYAAAVPVYQEWSDAAKARTESAGQEPSLGNIRLQHSIEIGGKATKIEYNDASKQIWLGSVPFNDAIRDDLRKGYYTGYSQGGSYAWRKCINCDNPLPLQQANNYCKSCKKDVTVVYGLKRISEVSYVDSPCTGVGFDYVKADGSKQLVKFSKRSDAKVELSKEQLDQVLAEVRKASAKTKRVAGEDLTAECFAYVGDPDKTDTWKLPIKFSTDAKSKRHIRNALARFEQTKGIPDDEKEKVKAKIVAAAKEHGIDAGEESKARQTFFAAIEKAAAAKGLAKDLWQVGRLADHLQGIAYLYEQSVCEREIEGDDSEVPEELAEILDNLIATFIAMAEEEATELAAKKSADNAKAGGSPMKPEELEELQKAAKKTLASHFAKSAVHHEKVAANHEKAAESHAAMCEACKADVGTEEEGGKVTPGPITKALGAHHKEMAAHHEKMAKAHSAHAEHLAKMAESHDKEEADKTVKAERQAGDPAPANKTAGAGDAKPADAFSLGADLAAGFAEYRKSDEYKGMISGLVKAEIQKALGDKVIPDGVKLADVKGGLNAVPRAGDSTKFEFADFSASKDTSGL
jgi:hypothetical protein